MNTYTYTWYHIPSGRRDIRKVRTRLTLKEFYDLLCKYNEQQPNVWLYAPNQ
jgi:hypothetical protein